MTNDEQLKLWVEGESIHNDDVWYNIIDETGHVVDRKRLDGGECCPDFSCCHPNLRAHKFTRERFCKAVEEDDQDTVDKMLMIFLGVLVATPEGGEKVYVAGDAIGGTLH